MQFEIHGKDIPITEQLRGHIQRRLSFALCDADQKSACKRR